MATQTKNGTTKVVERYLESYESAVDGAIKLERKAAELTKLEPVQTAVDAHIDLVRELTDGYVKTTRALLA